MSVCACALIAIWRIWRHAPSSSSSSCVAAAAALRPLPLRPRLKSSTIVFVRGRVPAALNCLRHKQQLKPVCRCEELM